MKKRSRRGLLTMLFSGLCGLGFICEFGIIWAAPLWVASAWQTELVFLGIGMAFLIVISAGKVYRMSILEIAVLERLRLRALRATARANQLGSAAALMRALSDSMTEQHDM